MLLEYSKASLQIYNSVSNSQIETLLNIYGRVFFHTSQFTRTHFHFTCTKCVQGHDIFECYTYYEYIRGYLENTDTDMENADMENADMTNHVDCFSKVF
jgi:hypothetical protein